jgi:hypothetical protein
MPRYVVIGVLAVVGLVPPVSAMTYTASAVPRSCPPSPDAGAIGLAVAPRSVTPGRTVHFQIDNSRAPTLTYGADYSIQECVVGVWKLAPFSPTVFTRQLIQQRPSRGRWWRVRIPTTTAIGKYRVRKTVSAGRRTRWLYGEFAVVADLNTSQARVLLNPLGKLSRLDGAPHVWKFHGTLGVRTVEISVGWVACKAGLGPMIHKYVTEGRGRATITILEKAQEIPPGTRCFRSRGTRELRVRLGQRIERVKIYDGSSSPPMLRYSGRRSDP